MSENQQDYNAGAVASASAMAWTKELKRYKDAFKDFTTKGDDIVARYRDERKGIHDNESRYNILWANVASLKPAIYSKPPKPEVSRRFKDKNPVARVAAMIIERALDYEITQYSDYHSALSNCVEDRLLPGRGVAWIRYEPVTEEIEAGITDDATAGDNKNYSDDIEPYQESAETTEANQLAGEEPLERITGETCPIDYVYWHDFAHLPARTWEEVTWVARRVYLSQNEGIERFGNSFKEIPLTNRRDEKEDDKAETKKAEIWEIWCKSTKKVHWLSNEIMLDERDDPLGLDGFFPCPKPIYATTNTKSLAPIADYLLYQDQARELDEITGRIQHITKALQVKGVYAADEQAIGRLLKEGHDGDMIPIVNWAAFNERGGLQGSFQLLTLTELALTLSELYKGREAAKQIIYEITGISDIIRGASNANETATAQQIKSQYAGLRLGNMKDDVARFAVDLLRMKADIMCSKYQPQTLIDASGIMYTPDAQYAEQAIQLLKNEPLRNFSIDIENDTLVEIDENAEKQSRIEFLTAASQFMEKTFMIGQQSPVLVPLLGEMLMFGVRGFKIGTSIEGTFETAMEQIKAEQEQAKQQPPKPDPEMMKLQASQQSEQARAQADMARDQAAAQAKQESEQMQAQVEAMKVQADNETARIEIEAKTKMEAARIDAEKYQTELVEKTKLLVAQLSADSGIKTAKISTANKMGMDGGLNELTDDGDMIPSKAVEELMRTMQESAAAQTQAIDALMQNQQQTMQALAEILTKPKEIIRGPDGKVAGIR